MGGGGAKEILLINYKKILDVKSLDAAGSLANNGPQFEKPCEISVLKNPSLVHKTNPIWFFFILFILL